jgi:histidyl-tRNA synthetase
MFQKMKGTYDLLPKDTGKWQSLERTIRNVSKLFNYSEIRTPIFENTDLFHRGVGEDTDMVSKETYDFIDRVVDTTDSEYYKWTQWIFVQLFKKSNNQSVIAF